MELFLRGLVVILSIFGCITTIAEAVPGDISRQKCEQYNNMTIRETRNTGQQSLKIAGGEIDAERKELPFVAALGFDDEDKKSYVCGGSLISESFVLTVAHCTNTRTLGEVKYVRFGDLNIKTIADDADAQELRVKRIYVHPEYDFEKVYHDIALIRLDGHVKMTSYVRPVCLNLVDDLEAKEFYAVGWALRVYGVGPSDHRQIVKLQHYDLASCQKTFPARRKFPAGITADYQICAKPIDQLADTCQGDSGGPLLYKSGRSFYVAGIVSFGRPCDVVKNPAVYTRVSGYVEWIEGIVWPTKKPSTDGRIHFPNN